MEITKNTLRISSPLLKHEQNVHEDDDEEFYHFKLIREYNWNRKDKTMRDDSIVYNEPETSLNFSWIRALLHVPLCD
jgi:hypothetical protein